ncbi:MAG: endonuclease MutS2 [Candidatus Delongbacteria bacterium]|jgi:DNA mismatch repair protein MutS2|nr:endonuclease MutS2 [Candidatus Delongbacteria bacterium]
MKDVFTEKVLGFDAVRDRLKSFASSEQGRRYIDELELTDEMPVILSSLDLVSEMKKLLSESEFPIHGIKDIASALDHLRGPDQLMEPTDLYNIAVTMGVARRVFSLLHSKRESYTGLYEICGELEIFEDVEENISRSVDEDGHVPDGASKELKSVRNSIQTAHNRIRKKTAEIFDAYTHAGYTREGEITIRDGRFVIPVRADRRNKVKGIVHDESATGGTVFVEPYEAIEINAELEKLVRQERKEVERIIRALSTQVFGIKNELQNNLEILAETDVIYAKARFSGKYHCAHPKVNNKNIVNIYFGRHPLLLDTHGEKGVVPLDLEIGEKYNTLVITGPNAGGKTVALKTVGLICIMVKAGMHVPAQSNSNIGVFSEIYTGIGDGQSIENDLSTFSSHISKVSRILKAKNKDTLILLDEIGASTDPAEGASLSMSILTELTKRKYITLATTHQGILKSFAYKTAGVENGSMEFDKKNITPTYRFRSGIPGSSYAFEISKRHGLPQYIIDRARKHLSSEKEDLEGLISELDEKITNYNNLLRQSKSVNQQLTELKEMYNKKFDDISKNEKKILKEAARKAQAIIDNSNKAIENAVAEIRSSGADKKVVKDMKSSIETEKKKIDVIVKEPEKKKEDYSGDLKPGMEVKVAGFSTTGIIESVSGKNVEVTVGSIKMRVKKSDILDVVEKSEDVNVNLKFSPSEDNAVTMRLDLRGKRGDEAVMLVERHIENMILHNITYSEIVHGKGQGILSKLVNEYLDRCQYIKRKKFGEYGEGDYGVTVIELK